MSKIVVTGGAGFIGSHIAEQLTKQDHEVIVVDNFSTGRRENLNSFVDRVTLQNCDITDLASLHNIMEGVDYVFHQAALPSVPRSIQHPDESQRSNSTGTLNVLIAAKDAGVKRLVYASSSSAYGHLNEPVKDENMVAEPVSPYGVAKLSGEHYCRAFHECYGFETVALRYFNVFGPRQNPFSAYTGVLAIFIPLMLQGKQPIVFGNGTSTRDFTFIQNNVHANILAMTKETAAGEMCNIACGTSISIIEIIDCINRILGTTIKPEFGPTRSGDIQHSCASLEKAKRVLGYEPQISFEDGLRETIEWYKFEIKNK